MPSVCFYFQVHQPKRLRHYSYFDIGQQHFYEDNILNENILLKVAKKCYLPTNTLMLELIKKHSGHFKIAYSISGVIIEQFKKFSPETLDSFKRLVDTGCVELLNETYYHSLSCLFSKKEFLSQIQMHQELIQQEFGQKPVGFRNTELIYNNDLGKWVESLGYQFVLAEGTEKILDWRSPNYVYQSANTKNLKLLLRNYSLSDDISFRFSNTHWSEHPLTVEKFALWVHQIAGNGDIVNLFMDYETFGEHQWEEKGIFQFLAALPEKILSHDDFDFCTPNEAIKRYPTRDILNVPEFFSWADIERDLTAWRGNALQEDALRTIYALEGQVKKSGNISLLNTWRSFLTSDHFYYMCTKWFADGDVHKYFNPYESPYLAYINFQNAIKDFKMTLRALEKV